MTALTIRLPDSIHLKIKELAAQDNVSVNQFIASAASEKLASMLTVEHLRREARLGKRDAFDRFLAAVPDVPDEADQVRRSSVPQ